MSLLKIELTDARVAFEPGEEITGTASWNLDQPPRTVELRLFWFTRGKGTGDAGVVETVRFDHPSLAATRPFRLVLPVAPYSFSGKLISLIWALELVVEPGAKVERLEITIAPDGKEVRLDSVPQPSVKQGFFQRKGR